MVEPDDFLGPLVVAVKQTGWLGHDVGMGSHHDVGGELLEVTAPQQIAFLEDRAVAGNHGFVTVLFGVGRIGKEVVPGEGDLLAVDFQPEAATELGLSGHPVDLDLVAFPFDRFAVFERFVDRYPVKSVAIGGDQGGVIVTAGIFALVRNAVQGPGLGSVLFLENVGVKEMIPVHVGNPKGVNPLESEMFFHSLNQTVKEELGEESGIKDEPSAVVRNDDRKVLAQGLGVELVKVRRDPVHERELGWFGIPVRFFRFHFVDRIAA